MPRPASILDKYTGDQVHAASQKLIEQGGGFASCIGEAYQRADLHNQQRLIAAFGHLFEAFIEKEETAAQ
jgi:hypothetical protein